MKNWIKTSLLLLLPILGRAQQVTTDSLRHALRSAATDSARYQILDNLLHYYIELNRDSALYYNDQLFTIALRNNYLLNEAYCLSGKGYILMHLGKYPESFQCFQQALTIVGDPQSEYKAWKKNTFFSKILAPREFRLSILANTHHSLGLLMNITDNTGEQISQFKEAGKLAEELNDQRLLGFVNMNLGSSYLKFNRLDSALVFEKNAERLFNQIRFRKYISYDYEIIAMTYLRKGNEDLALQYFHKGINAGIKQNAIESTGYCYGDLARYFLSKKQKDSSLYYATKECEALNFIGYKDLSGAYENIYQSYKLRNERDSAYKYQGLALMAKDSSSKATLKSLTDFQKLSFKHQIQLQELAKEKTAIQTRVRTYLLSAGIGLFMLLASIFYRNNRQKQKANYLLSEQKEEIETQRDNLGQALNELKNTQTQLVQREKMASLGELTAGIAHEIQNPLNFVNNFSDVNTELLDELQQEISRGDLAEIKAIAVNVQENEKKINMHGRRADGIVKGMLQHSRSSSATKEPTNINALADEYLRLSYHGLRAKDKDFNAELVTHFDANLPKVNAITQDIGRIMLNLFNNAFYAVNQKQKTAGADYKPEVTITTARDNGQVVIKVKDNGTGMPDAIKDKIMQPFFTTKPTGEGTGLGLSLTYDMVVKGHGGSIDVDSREGEFTEFTIKLPVQ
jgi:two-component system, NtrC family, sensor kinase